VLAPVASARQTSPARQSSDDAHARAADPHEQPLTTTASDANTSAMRIDEAYREVHCGDSIPWLRERGKAPGTSVVTSLPDVSEVGMDLVSWRVWFIDAVKLCVDATSDECVAIFFQTDIKRDGRTVDKGSLVVRAAEDAGAHVLFHKVVCRRPPGHVTFGRPAFTHLVAVSRAAKAPSLLAIPDVVVDAGKLTWVRAMGMKACGHAVRFVKEHTPTTVVLDPFCGVGTVLAVANALELNAIGVERSKKRCARARELDVTRAMIDE